MVDTEVTTCWINDAQDNQAGKVNFRSQQNVQTAKNIFQITNN